VFFQVPLIGTQSGSIRVGTNGIDREVLLGLRGENVRYWGYCFADDANPDNPRQSSGFPGKIFLSEAERAWRKAQESRLYALSPFRRPIAAPKAHESADPIRHQLDVFRGGMTCYIMSASELPFGIDDDGDRLNAKLEHDFNTDPLQADTDGDGIPDGVEAQHTTSPTRRDTDGDGLIDGIEDKNRDGTVSLGETDPRKTDTDGDNMHDGPVHVDKVRRICKDNRGSQCIDVPYGILQGEDKNLNGKVDAGETDPTKADSLGDGVQDDQRFFNCLLAGRKDC
jgi:hypothetical protein